MVELFGIQSAWVIKIIYPIVMGCGIYWICKHIKD